MSRIVFLILLSLSVLTLRVAVATEAGSASQPAVGPEINIHYQEADPARWLQVFERPGRELFDRREAILEALELRPGMAVADVGAGTGLFTLLFANAVGAEGRVYAVDISESFIAAIRERASAAGHDNVVGVVNDQQTVALPAESVDLVFIADTYHHFEYPYAMLSAIRTALRPGGILALIDFRRDPAVSSRWVMSHVRAGRAQVIEEVRAAGFELLDEPVRLRGNYFLRFLKPSA